MKIKELLNENTGITLGQLYNGHYPDRDEVFWDYVSNNELDIPLSVHQLSPHRLGMVLMSQYGVEHIDELDDIMDDDQKDIVNYYMNDSTLSSKIIVMFDGRIVDGNHRALAAARKGVSINYVDLEELDGEEE